MMEDTNGKALKAGIWYVVATFMTKGVVFLTTPIFTRLLTKEEYGTVSTYNSWLGIFTVLATLDLYSCLQIAKVDFKAEKEKFLSAILCLSSLAVLAVYGVVRLAGAFHADFVGMPVSMLTFMFLEILFRNVFNLLQTHHRSYLKYKEFVFFSIITTVISPILAIILVQNMEDHRVWGNIIGNALPIMLLSFFLAWYILQKGRCLYRKEYWIYGLKISLPLIPHHLAGNILNHFDRIIINKIAGSGQTALYSVVSSYALIVQVIWTSFNNAWVPWFYDKMKENDAQSLKEIKTFVKPYLGAFSLVAIGVIAIAPEAIKIFGSKEYWGSEYSVAPIVMGVYCQFVYSLFANIEFYYKKTTKLAKGTMIAAVINIVLNIYFIPIGGYTAAAYTTFASYFILLVMHYFMARKIDSRDIYGNKFLFLSIAAFFGVTVLFILLYKYIVIRYMTLLVVCLIFLAANRKILIEILRKAGRKNRQ